jgi:hypothetical protein
MPIKPVKFIISLDDINDLNIGEEEISAIKDRLKYRYTFGTNFNDVVTIFPFTIAQNMRTEERIVRKLNYTVTHELIHGLLEDVELNTEEICHGLTMILNDDVESNRSGSGYGFLRRYSGRLEIVANDTEEEEEPQFEAQIPKAILTEAEITNANRNLSRERLAKFHVTIG